METTKTSNFTCQSESFISIFFTCQVSACELQPFSCHDLANDIRSQTAKTVFSHLKKCSGSSQLSMQCLSERIGSSGARWRTLVARKEEFARRQQFIIKVSSWRFYNQQEEVLNQKSLGVIDRFVFNNLAGDNAGNKITSTQAAWFFLSFFQWVRPTSRW